mmetsp:Transcript_7907/g.20322  ORF Transcript_7907/g.20322 Transcript_7907/m.20322 type:complete len:283 (-) Transcript_7907:236-1084(-)
MPFQKYYESEGLAAVARALREKQQQAVVTSRQQRQVSCNAEATMPETSLGISNVEDTPVTCAHITKSHRKGRKKRHCAFNQTYMRHSQEREASLLTLRKVLQKNTSRLQKASRKLFSGGQHTETKTRGVRHHASSVGTRAASLLMRILPSDSGSYTLGACGSRLKTNCPSMLAIVSAAQPDRHATSASNSVEGVTPTILFSSALQQYYAGMLSSAAMSTQQSTEERPIRHATSENHFRSLFVDEFAEDLEHIRNAAPNGAAQNIESIVQFIKACKNTATWEL